MPKEEQPEYARKVPPPGDIEYRGVVSDVVVPIIKAGATIYAAHKVAQSSKPPEDKK
jgi:hypothetical protein